VIMSSLLPDTRAPKIASQDQQGLLLEVAGWLLGVAMFIRRTAWSRGFTKLGHACVICC